MPQERAEKRIDELPVLSEVTGTERLPIEDGGVAKSVTVETLLARTATGQGLTEEIKTALLTIAQKVAYVDEHGQTYYDALYNALYPPATLLSISAVFAQGSHVVYDTDTLDSLKQYLTVTGEYDDGTSREVTSYTLSGTLVEGTSTITVTASGRTDTFTVTVTHRVWAVTSIDAVFNQGSATVYSNQSLDSLRQYLTVNATFENGDTSAVSDYTLSGTLTVGTSTITASYGGKTDTFTVTVTEAVATLVSISAVFTQGDHAISEDDSLDALRQYLVVTANYDDSTSTVVNDYTLSGTLAEGTSTITVSYEGFSDTFDVVVTGLGWTSGVPYDMTDGLIENKYLNNGAEANYSGWAISPYLPIRNAWIITSRLFNLQYCGAYDSEKVYSALPKNNTMNDKGAPFRVPGKEYLRVSESKSKVTGAVITPYKYDALLGNTVWESGKWYEMPIDDSQTGYYDENGTYNAGATYRYTALLNCYGATKLTRSVGAMWETFCFYDGNGDFISGVLTAQSSTAFLREIEVPADARYVRVSALADNLFCTAIKLE